MAAVKGNGENTWTISGQPTEPHCIPRRDDHRFFDKNSKAGPEAVADVLVMQIVRRAYQGRIGVRTQLGKLFQDVTQAGAF